MTILWLTTVAWSITSTLDSSFNTLTRKVSFTTHSTIDGMHTYTRSLSHIGNCRQDNTHRRLNRNELLRPEVVTYTQWHMLTDLNILQLNPLIRPNAQFM